MQEEEVQRASWGDVELESISWTNEGRDMAFGVRFPDLPVIPNPRMTLHCRWASNLRMDVHRAENMGGRLLTWGARFEQTEGGWAVNFDFAADGHISLRCSSVELTATP
jgi:hypothetical protein